MAPFPGPPRSGALRLRRGGRRDRVPPERPARPRGRRRPCPGRPPAARLADSVTVVSGVEVARERALSDARRLLPTAFVTDLRADDRTRATESLSGLLSEAAGVHVTQYGGLGAFSTVSLRGASPGQVTILLDGVPLTSAAHGVVSLGDLPATAVERVEIYRGLGPLGLGVATPGGAVNLVTVSSPGLRELHLSRGSFGTWEGRATGGLERGALSVLLHAGYQGSAGDYRYLDDHGTAYNAADDTVRTRLNDRFDAWTALANAEWRPRPRLRARLRGDVFAKAQGLPGRGATPALGTRLAFLRSLGVAELERAGEGLVPRATLRLSSDRGRSRFHDLRLADRGELGLGRHDTDDRTRSDALALSLAWARPADWLALEGAFSLRRETADPHDAAAALPDPPGKPPRRARRRGADPAADARRPARAARGAALGPPRRPPALGRGRHERGGQRRGARAGLAPARRAARAGPRARGARELGAGQPGARVRRAVRRPGQRHRQPAARARDGREPRRRAGVARALARARGRARVGALPLGRARPRGLRAQLGEHGPGAQLRPRPHPRRGVDGAARPARPPAALVGLVVAVGHQPGAPARVLRRQAAARAARAPGHGAARVAPRPPPRPARRGRAADHRRQPARPLQPAARRRARTLVGASLSVAPLRAAAALHARGPQPRRRPRRATSGGFPLPGRSLYVGCTYRDARAGGSREPAPARSCPLLLLAVLPRWPRPPGRPRRRASS